MHIEEMLEELLKRQQEQKTQIERLENLISLSMKNQKAPATVTVREYARMSGCSAAQLYKKPELLPLFGESAFSSGRKRWPAKTAFDWLGKSETEKHEMYVRYLENLHAEAGKRAEKKLKELGLEDAGPRKRDGIENED